MSAINIKPDSFLPIKATQKRKSTEPLNSESNRTVEDVVMSETKSVSSNVSNAKKVRLDSRKISVPPHR